MKMFLHILGFIILGIAMACIPGALPATEYKTPDGCSLTFGNPAAEYCSTIMGYEYSVITSDGGQSGTCTMPDGETCSEWDFYAGKCGREYSWCEQAGYDLESRTDGIDPYAPEYSACVDKAGNELGTTAKLSGLSDLARRSVIDFSLPPGEETVVELNYDSEDIPSSFNWAFFLGQNWLTVIKDQGTCGSCWAFSSVALTETQWNIRRKQPNVWSDFSEGYLVSNCCPDLGSCNGEHPFKAMNHIRDVGVPLEGCYPYWYEGEIWGYSIGWQCVPTVDWCWANGYYWQVPNTNHTYSNAEEMKYIISHYGPIIVTIGFDDAYGGDFYNGVYWCTHDVPSDGNTGINHAVLVFGYNDSLRVWYAKNSWGYDWNGDAHGTFWLGYDECNVGLYGIDWVKSPLPYPYESYLPLLINDSIEE